MENTQKEKSRLMNVLFVLGILACIYVVVVTIVEIKGYRFIGGGAPASNVISFDGKGEVLAKPDLATISFTLRDNQKEMTVAQAKVTEKETAAMDFLTKNGIDKKDIKTDGYNSYPKYENPTPCWGDSYYPCRSGEPKIIGYEVSQNISVKIRDLAKAGEIVKGLGGIGVSEISGPNFSIEKEEDLREQARKMAIEEAQEKAKILSKDLGVSLVRIVNFSENGTNPVPMMYESKAAGMGMMDQAKSTTPELPTGENKIVSNVTITYEIR